LINSLAERELSPVSEASGTTAEPVMIPMIIPGIGPVMIFDTPGIDEVGDAGEKKMIKTLDTLKSVDLAILVISDNLFAEPERKLIERFVEFSVPFVVVHNRSDLAELTQQMKNMIEKAFQTEVVDYNSLFPVNTVSLVKAIKRAIPESAYLLKSMVADMVKPGELVLLITGADGDGAAGHLQTIQLQLLHDALESDAMVAVVKEREAERTGRKLIPRPKLVVVEDYFLQRAHNMFPWDTLLSSFSILNSRHKGNFEHLLKGTPALSELKDGDAILFLRGCGQGISCNDEVRADLAGRICRFSGKTLDFSVTPTLVGLKTDLRKFAMIVQCDGCSLTRGQMVNYLKPAVDAGIPVTSSGMAMAWLSGVFERLMKPLFHKENTLL
jgi:[FeFe] hydrogenase H-cluster maturation GTPase HydF